jgi:hypothetical protein
VRSYEVKEREIVTREECVEVRCDMCGRKAENPSHDSPWVWGGAGDAKAELSWQFYIDGEDSKDSLDLCYECAEWLAKQIRRGAIKRGEAQP